MDELFRPNAVPVKGADYFHDVANPNDDPQIEATRRLLRQQMRRPRRRISVTEREEQAADVANKFVARAPTKIQTEEEPAPKETSSDDAAQRAHSLSINGSTSSVAFSYKDLYGSDDEVEFIAANNDWKNIQRKQQQQSNNETTNSADDDVIECEKGKIDFTNRVDGRYRRIDSTDSGCSSIAASMVSVSMTPENKCSGSDSIGELIADLDNYYNKTPNENSKSSDECSNGQVNGSDGVEGSAKREHQDSLLKSAVESLKQLPLFRPNGTEDSQLATRQHQMSKEKLNGDDESDQTDNNSMDSPHRPLHQAQSDETAKRRLSSTHNSLSSISDSSKNLRNSINNISSMFGRFQIQNSSNNEAQKSAVEEPQTTKEKDVDDETPSTNSSSCPSPDTKTKLKIDHGEVSLLESMAREAQIDLSELERNLRPIQTTSLAQDGSLDIDPRVPSCGQRESLTGIFSAALSNDENGERGVMGEEKKAVIIDQLQLLAKKDSLRSMLRKKREDDDLSSGTPRFRSSMVEDFVAASKRDSFHRKMSNEGSHEDSVDTLEWPSPVSSLASPQDQENLSLADETTDEQTEGDDVEKDSESVETQSIKSKEVSIELDLSCRNPETSNVDHANSLESSIEWPILDKSDSKRSCDISAAAHKNAVSKTANARNLLQTFRQSSMDPSKAATMNSTKSEKTVAESSTEAIVEATEGVKIENGEKGLGTYNHQTESSIRQTTSSSRPSISSSRQTNSSSRLSTSSSRQTNLSSRLSNSSSRQTTLSSRPSTSSSRQTSISSRPSYSSSRMSSSQSSHRSTRLWGRNRRLSDASMSSLESFASATNRAKKARGNLERVKSQESISTFGSVTSVLYRNKKSKGKKEDRPKSQDEFIVSVSDLNESPGNIVNYPLSARQLSRNSGKSDVRTSLDGSLCVEDFDGNSSSSSRPSMNRPQSGLANDVPLLLNSATSLISHYSTDGIEHIDPSSADSDDFDFAMNSYANGIKYGHFDVPSDLNDDQDNDLLLAAKAYMGLGFVRQCRGELASSYDAYMKALELCKAEIGHDDPFLANLQYACGNVLNEMDRNLEASTHFRQALNFYKSRESDGVDAKVNSLFIEGMMLAALNETKRAIEYFREGIRLNQTSQRPLNLKLASAMYGMGSIYSQNGEYTDAASYFNVALHIRKSNLGDSFVVARTHYSLGVTLASQEVLTNTTTDAFSHLEEALRICQKEFDGNNLQTAVILHSMGVLKERKGDFLSASSWFKRERDMLIALFGEDHNSIISISSDLGTCYYNVGKYESARNMFQDALRIISLSNADGSTELADILYKIASCHDSLCDFDEALEIFTKVKEIRRSNFGMENGQVIQTMLRIGNVLLCQGEASTALKCFGEVLGIGYASDSINPIEIANALYGRGCAQFCQFQLTDAMKSFSDSLNWKLQALGENDPGLACIFYQMAHVHLQKAENEEALTYFEEYVRLSELDPQLNLPDQAQICFTKGIIAKIKENYVAALSLYKQALEMFDTLFGGKHEKIASIHFDIGCVMSELGDSTTALRHFQVCLFQRKQLLGVHVDVADVLLNMASMYTKEYSFEAAANCLEDSDRIWKSKLGHSEKLLSVLMISGKRWKCIHRFKEAESNFEQALEMAITMYGQKHELVADILLDLGELLQEIEQTQQAFFCFDESIEIRSSLFGIDSPSVAKAVYSKGVAHIFQGQFEEAADCLDRALTIRREKIGPKDSVVGDTLNTIGFLQLKMDNIEGQDALDPLMEALVIRRAIGNKGKVVSTLQNILSLYKKRKDYESCIEVNSDILVVRQEDFGPTHEQVAEAWINLGNVQASAGKFITARASYEESLRIRTLNHGYQHRLVAQVLFKLGSLSARESNFDDAKKFFEAYMMIRAEEESDPDEEMAQALTLMGDLQKETGEKSKAQINWTSAIEIYQQLGYEDDHKKLMRLHERQRSLGHMIGLFGFGRKESYGRKERSVASRRNSTASLADNLSVLGLKIGGDDNASVVSKLTFAETVTQVQQRSSQLM